MGRKKQKVHYHLDPKGIKELPFVEIKAILRGADELIATGGRNMLAKILKGSKDKKLLQYGLDKSSVYGFYQELKIEEITARVDWMINKEYLAIEYSGRLQCLSIPIKGGKLSGIRIRTSCWKNSSRFSRAEIIVL
jgi:superfamily II DNA helicase RecQ